MNVGGSLINQSRARTFCKKVWYIVSIIPEITTASMQLNITVQSVLAFVVVAVVVVVVILFHLRLCPQMILRC